MTTRTSAFGSSGAIPARARWSSSRQKKAWGADYLRFGLALASDFQGDNAFNALVQYRKTWLNRLGGEWTTEAQIGQNTHVWTEFYQPLNEAGQWFIAPSALIGQQTRGAFVGQDKVADYLISVGQVGVDLGTGLGTWGQLRGGAVWSKVFARVDTGSPVLPSVREATAGLRAAFFVDQTDTAWFPSAGYGFTGTAYAAMTSFGSAQSYQRLEGNARGIHSWGPNVFNVAVSGGTALGSDMPAYESFTLGGPLRLSGYRINEFSGREYAFGRLMYYHRIFSLPDILGSGLYVGGSAEVGRHHQPLRQLAVAGNAVVRIGVPRSGYVPRAGVPGSRLRRSRQLEPLPAARRAVVASSGAEPGIAHHEIQRGRPGAVRHVDAGVHSELACQLVAEAEPSAADVLGGDEGLPIGSSGAGAAEGDDAPAAHELPARLELDRSRLVTLIARRGHAAQLHERPEEEGRAVR